MRGAGVSAPQLAQAGAGPGEAKMAGYTAAEACTVADWTCEKLRANGAGYEAHELKAASKTAAELKAGGFTAAELKLAGYAAEKMLAAGFSGEELTAAGFVMPAPAA